VFDCAAPVIVKRLVIVRSDIAAGKYLLQVLKEFGIYGHYIFEMPVLRAVLDHQDLAVVLYYLGLELPDFLIAKDIDREFTVENLVANLGHTFWAKRIGRSGPPQWRLRLLVRLQQRLVRPPWYESWILPDLVYLFENGPYSSREISKAFFCVLDGFPHRYIGS
jgi:hypothetical protein